MIPSRECGFMWRLNTASYGLVNFNGKWQNMSDNVFRDLGLKQCTFIPELFYAYNSFVNLIIVDAMNVDDIIVTGTPIHVDSFLCAFYDIFILGSVASGPGQLSLYGMNIIQNSDYNSTIDADHKLGSLEAFPLTRCRLTLPGKTMTPT